MSNDTPEKGNKKTKKEEPPPEHIIKQRIWRENQLNIFYKTGRPIYNCFRETDHLYYKNNEGTYIGSFY
jgi:hypothetical protein